MAKRIVTDERLIKVVVAGIRDGKTKSEIAKELGLKPASLALRVSKLRSKGVPIPRFPRPARKTEDYYEKLKELAERLINEAE